MEMTTAAHLCIFVNSFYDVMLANNSEMQRIYGFSMRPDSNYVVGKLHKYKHTDISAWNGVQLIQMLLWTGLEHVQRETE
jgi:hypothetical protein